MSIRMVGEMCVLQGSGGKGISFRMQGEVWENVCTSGLWVKGVSFRMLVLAGGFFFPAPLSKRNANPVVPSG